MTAQGKTVSAIDIAKGALGFIPDIPQIIPTLANLALLRPNARKSLGLLFQDTARKNARHVFLKSEDQSWTYAQANAVCNQMARGLLAVGVQAGDTVRIDVATRRIDVDADLATREPKRINPRVTTGALAKYARLVSSASQGAVTAPGPLQDRGIAATLVETATESRAHAEVAPA